jgi:hypothetical protein
MFLVVPPKDMITKGFNQLVGLVACDGHFYYSLATIYSTIMKITHP